MSLESLYIDQTIVPVTAQLPVVYLHRQPDQERIDQRLPELRWFQKHVGHCRAFFAYERLASPWRHFVEHADHLDVRRLQPFSHAAS